MTPCETRGVRANLATSPLIRRPRIGESTRGATPRQVAVQRNDAARFFRSWLRNPLKTAAVAPSSRSLAHLMTKDIAPSDRVVELGPGTGVFTRALVSRGVPASQLTLVESNAEFVGLLRNRFAEAHVVHADAAFDSWPLADGADADAVVSGLPLLSMSAADVSAVLSQAFTRLTANGGFYQFTYGPKCPVRASVLAQSHLGATLMGRTVRNLPPASVYRIHRTTQSLESNR